jgi:hypothetical protein
MSHLHILSTSENKESLLNSGIASNRLRLAYLSEAAISKGLNVTIGFTIPPSASIVFVGKLTSAFGDALLEHYFKELYSCKAIIIVDYTDDWLSTEGATSAIYKKLIKLSSAITVSTKGLIRETKKIQKNHFIVSDGLDKVGPIVPKEKSNEIKEVLWFGHSTNIMALTEYLNSDFGQNEFIMNILSNEKAFNYIQDFNFKPNRGFKISSFLWSFDNLTKLGNQCDLKLLPVKKPFASSNRLLTAFNLGLPVITSSIESYKPFSKYYAEIGTREVDQLFNEPFLWSEKVLNAQRKTQLKFDKEKIINKWSKILTNVLFLCKSA